MYAIFRTVSDDADKAFEQKNSQHPKEEGVIQQYSASPLQELKLETEIFGQAGERNARDWVQQALTPYTGN
jgi:hypothetical protein